MSQHISQIYSEKTVFKSKFLGVETGQNVNAIPLLSELIEYLAPKNFIEIGCGQLGGLSVFLAIAAKFHRGTFLGIDTIDPKYMHEIFFEGGTFTKVDNIFNPQTVSTIIKSMSKGKTIIFCNNVDKIEAINTFCHAMKRGDVILAHPYLPSPEITEFWNCSDVQIERVLDRSLERIFPAQLEQAAWIAWRKR